MTDPTTSHPSPSRMRRPSGEPPPLPHELNKVAVGWLVAFGFWASTWAWVFLSDQPAIWITERDLQMMEPVIDLRTGWLTGVMQATNEIVIPWLTIVLGWVTIVGGLATRRIRHVLLYFASLSLCATIATVIANRIGRPRPLGFERIGQWEGFAQPYRDRWPFSLSAWSHAA